MPRDRFTRRTLLAGATTLAATAMPAEQSPDPLAWTLNQAAAELAKRTISSEELTRLCLERIARLDHQLNAWRLYQEALKHSISVSPGQLFSARGQFRNCLRLSYSRPWDTEVEDGLRTLGRLIGKIRR